MKKAKITLAPPNNKMKTPPGRKNQDRTSLLFRILIPTFSFEENVGIADFSNFCDMHFRNDKNVAEKESEAANLGKRKWKTRNGNLADWIFEKTETEFDENAKMQVDFVGRTDEL